MNQKAVVDVTIFLFVFNHIKYVAKGLDALVSQKTEYKYELVVIDDGSTDGSRELLQDYATKYPDIIRLYFSEKNKGNARAAAFALNPAINGSFICYLEGDDYWTSFDKIQKQVDYLKQNPDYVGCARAFEIIAEHKESSTQEAYRITEPSWSLEDVLAGGKNLYCHTSTWMWRKKFETVFPDKMRNDDFAGDLMLTLFYLQYGQAGYIDEVMSCYRMTGEGKWSTLSAQEQDAANLKLLYRIDDALDNKYTTLMKERIKRGRLNYKLKYNPLMRYFYPLIMRVKTALKI